MRIQVLWNDGDVAHIEPLERASDTLAGMGYSLAIERCPSLDRACATVDVSADALLVHQELLSDELLASGPPVIIHERIDGAQLAASRQWLDREEVAAVIKAYSFREVSWHNAVRGRFLTHMLSGEGVLATGQSKAIGGNPSPILGSATLQKIHVGYGFASYDRMKHFHGPVDWESPRPIPVSYAGTVSYAGSEIETHRRMAVDAVKACGGEAHSGRPMQVEDYCAWLDRSVAVVSPWGWGEACYRDYEAILRGCVLIKPDTRYVKGWPDVFADDAPILWCRPDWSDLPERVEQAREAQGLYAVREEAKDWRCRLLNAWKPLAIALRMESIVRQVL